MLEFQFRCLTLCSDNAHVTFSQGQVTSEGQAVSSNSVEASQNPRRIAAKILVPCSRSAVFNFEFAFENCFWNLLFVPWSKNRDDHPWLYFDMLLFRYAWCLFTSITKFNILWGLEAWRACQSAVTVAWIHDTLLVCRSQNQEIHEKV